MTKPSSIDPADFVRPEIRALSVYSLELEDCLHKLDQNEVPWELPRRVRQAVADQLVDDAWARYPDFHSDALRQAVASANAHPWQGVLVGNGSNELLQVALSTLAGPGTEVLSADPSFALYKRMILASGARPVFIPPRADLSLPIDELLAQVESYPRRPLLLCSPNNPTGAAATVEEVEAILQKIEAPLLLDNAYGEFCRYDYRPLLARYPQLLLFRTLSKAWSLAGLRVGAVLGDPRLIDQLVKLKLPYNLNRASALAGCAALAAHTAVERRIRVLLGRRPQWAELLEQCGFEVFPSEANFLLVRSPKAREFRDLLAQNGIRVRDMGGYPGLEGCLRVSVGTGRALRAVRETLTPDPSPTSRPPARERGAAARPRSVDVVGVGASPSPGRVEVRWERGTEGVRVSTIHRETRETQIRLTLNLDGGPRRISVPNGFFGHMLDALTTHGGFGIDLVAQGDVHVDSHHTVEDVGIALGEAIAQALGERKGIARFAHAYAPLDEALARAVVDLSGRGHFSWSAPPALAASWVTADFPLTLVADFFGALADRGRLTLHLEVLTARNGHHAAEAAFKAAALALREAVRLRGGDVPSTKGSLST